MLLITYMRYNSYGWVARHKALTNEAFKIKYEWYLNVSENIVITK